MKDNPKIPQILPTGAVSWAFEKILKEYNNQNIEALVAGVILKDGSFVTVSTGQGQVNPSYLEHLGLISQMEEDYKTRSRVWED